MRMRISRLWLVEAPYTGAFSRPREVECLWACVAGRVPAPSVACVAVFNAIS